MYSIKFSGAGYEVKTADASDVALKILRDGYDPTVMLVDILMPKNVGGLEFLDQVRTEKLAPHATTIILTNQGSSEDVGQAKKLNVDGYIVKATTIPSDVLKEVENIQTSRKS